VDGLRGQCALVHLRWDMLGLRDPGWMPGPCVPSPPIGCGRRSGKSDDAPRVSGGVGLSLESSVNTWCGAS